MEVHERSSARGIQLKNMWDLVIKLFISTDLCVVLREFLQYRCTRRVAFALLARYHGNNFWS
jgi:hypothetical protein